MRSKDFSLLVIASPPLNSLKECTLTVTDTAFLGISDALLYIIVLSISIISPNDYKKIDT